MQQVSHDDDVRNQRERQHHLIRGQLIDANQRHMIELHLPVIPATATL